MRGRVLVCLLFLLASCAAPTADPVEQSPSPSPSPNPTPAFATSAAVITKITDGDTVDATLDGKTETLRLIGVDTPERGRPYFKEASDYTSAGLLNKNVFLEIGTEQRDRFGRLLVHVWLAQPFTGDEQEVRASMFNAKLLSDGYAQLLTVPPNVKYVDLFTKLQEEARTGNKGLWTAPPSPSPKPPTPEKTQGGDCDPAYPTVCIPSPPPDLDCGEISHRRFTVRDPDPHGFDNDDDGVGCESG